jgi:hypothetical protein
MKKWFENGVRKLHPEMKKQFEKNGIYDNVNPDPVIFFWGDKSKDDLKFVENQLNLIKSPAFSSKVRQVLTMFLHDAIWVQKPHNMNPIITDLNTLVKSEHAKGNQVVLFGYSAGSFVTYEYMFNMLPYAHGACLAENCIPADVLKGVVNFASPLPLFYSDMADYESAYLAGMLKYILENGIFWITVNYREDPLGFPAMGNFTNAEFEKITKVALDSPSGFIFDNSKTHSRRPVVLTHTSYWSTKNTFAKAVAKTYLEGRNFRYDPEAQAKMLEKQKKYEIKGGSDEL